MPGTVSITFVIAAPVERIWKAFGDADATSKFLPPYGFTCKVFSLNFKSGGTYKMAFTNFSTGKSHGFTGKFATLKTHQLIKQVETFDDAALAGEMTTSIEFRKVSSGTELKILQQGIPDLLPADGCYIGWQQTLAQLALLVEPDIPNGEASKKEEENEKGNGNKKEEEGDDESKAKPKAESKEKKRKRN